jgi:hypothetical protein
MFNFLSNKFNKINNNAMKTRIYTPVILLMSSILFSPETAAFEIMNVSANETSGIIEMEMSTPSPKSFDLYLLDKRGQTIYESSVSEGSTFDKSLDMKNFRNGTYTLVSVKESMKYHRVIEIRDSRVELKETFFSFTPQFKVEGDVILVHFINQNKDIIDVSIENRSGFLYQTAHFDKEPVFSQAYGIDNLQKGYYTLSFSAGRDLHTFDFEVK